MPHTTARHADLKIQLTARRREMQQDVRGRIREGRADRSVEVGDDLEHSDADVHGDLELLLLGMRADAVLRVDEALARIDTGLYGKCAECDGRITARRLRAQPFAVRCHGCQARREQEQGAARQDANRRAAGRFAESASS